MTPRAPQADHDALLEQAVALHRDCRLTEAEALYREILAADPDDPEVLQRLGAALAAHGDDHLDEALALLHRAAEVAGPADAATAGLHNNLGNALRRAARHGEAEAELRSVVAAVPDHWEAWHNLGQTLHEAGRDDEAAAALRRSMALRPEYTANYYALGATLTALGRLNAAVAMFRRAIELGHRDNDVVSHLAVVHRQLGELDHAEQLLREVVAAVPHSASANSNLAVVLAQTGQFDESRIYHDRAMELDPDHVPFVANRAYARLTAGDIPGAWTDWERAIDNGPRGRERPFTARRWQGEDVRDARVLVYREQGVGDEILFASCYPDLVERAGSVMIESDPRVATLFARSFAPAEARPQTLDGYGRETVAEIDADVVVPAGSLPVFLRRTLDEFPERDSYLVADPARVEAWRERLADAGDGPRVGISWRSKLMTAERRLEYTRLSEWGGIFSVPGVTFFNLQYDECEQDLADAERRFGVTVHRYADVDYMNDFESVAALMANLDLVVAPRNAVAMLAGALGVPTVMMGNRWDWSDLGTDTCPWLPAVTLVYRHLGQDWDGVLATAASRVAELTRPATH